MTDETTTTAIDLGTNIPPDPVVTAKVTKAVRKPREATGLDAVKMIRIVLEENEDIPPTGLYVGHNGTGYLIQTGVEVDVPEHVLNVLDNAVMSFPQMDPSTQQVIGYRERRRYNYRRLAA